MRRFVAGVRAITSALASALLLSRPDVVDFQIALLMLGYCLWAALVLWAESPRAALWHHWVDVIWSCVMLQLVHVGTGMLVLTFVNPIVVVSTAYGFRQGLVLALVAAAGIALDTQNYVVRDLAQGWTQRLPAILVLALVPMTAVLTRPLNLLRRRIASIGALEFELDPRRGLEPVCAEMVEKLRQGTSADVVALVLPSARSAPAMLASSEDGSFRLKPEIHVLFETLLTKAPPSPVSFVRRARWDPRPGLKRLGSEPVAPGLARDLGELAATLGVSGLHVVPLTRYGRRSGHFVVGFRTAGEAPEHASPLAGAASELLRIIEQATLVDQLQDETAAHERARIGRDLHDSAIQPYLGLKYAVESVALRIARDNPARVELDSLAELVNAEVSALRELISGLRTGESRADDALVPAVRRQVKRFALLFGIDVEVDCPESLPTSRATASALFHMVNEALNNIRKHTAARRVSIGMSIVNSSFRLVVRDDGGSVRGEPVADFRPTSLSERVAELRGRLSLSLPDGLNSELVIEIPL